ncbi:butyrophilin subfamily 1 member A1-like [Chlamydotis macqueenii]
MELPGGATAAQRRREMAFCSFCREPFKTLLNFTGCKHRICGPCASQLRVDAAGRCPRCRLLPPARKASEEEGRMDGEGAGNPSAKPLKQLCPEHREALEMFCVEDRSLICRRCAESQAHRAHAAIPLQEAAEGYKTKLEAAVKRLRQRKAEALRLKSQEEEKLAEWKNKASRESEKIEKEFEKLHNFLDEEEEKLQRRLKKEEKGKAAKLHGNIAQMTKQSQALGELINEINEKRRQPAWGLLKDVESLLSRYRFLPGGCAEAFGSSRFSSSMIRFSSSVTRFSGSVQVLRLRDQVLQLRDFFSSKRGMSSRCAPKPVTLQPATGHKLETLGTAFSQMPSAACTHLLRPPMRRPASPRGLLSYFVALHVLRLGSAEFRVVGPDRPLRAAVGQDVVLPCHLSPRGDARHLDIRWIRHQFSDTVHHYRDGQDQYGEQMKEYAGRTQLVKDGLSNGSLDLQIVGLEPSDHGQYVCVVKDAASYGEATLDLEVTAAGSVPRLSLEAYEDGGIRVACRSAGWYPQPQLLWKDPGGRRLPSLSQRRSPDERGLFAIEGAIVVTGRGDGDWSCVVGNSHLGQERESSLRVSGATPAAGLGLLPCFEQLGRRGPAPFFHDARPWMAALGVFLVLSLALFGLSAYLFRRTGTFASEERRRDAALAWRKFLLPQNPDVVTLDPNTAHPALVVSKDLRSVRFQSTEQDLPNNPERFKMRFCVMGREGFKEGRHCWEVEVKGKVRGDSWWAVGVARDNVERKLFTDLSPDGGIWAIRFLDGQVVPLTHPHVPLGQAPRRIRVCLDCTKGQVTFINADNEAKIFAFPPGSFNKDIIRPWFWLNTELCLGRDP